MVLEVKNPLANVGDLRDTGSVPGSGRSLEEGMTTSPVFFPRTGEAGGACGVSQSETSE